MVHSNPLKVFVTNSLVANTNSTIPTIAAGEVLILDRALAALSTDTIAGNANNDLIYIALGLSTGVAKTVAIPTKGIKKVTTSLYTPPVQHKIVLNAAAVPATSAAGTNFNIKLFFHDTHRQMDEKEGRQFFTYTSVAANESAATIYTGLAAKINAVSTFSKQVTATVVGSTLEIVGLAVTDNAFGLPQFRYFDVALRSGFTVGASSTTVTAGNPGKGVGSHIKHLELKGIYDFNRTQWPLNTDTRLASDSGVYNTVTITYETTNTSAFGRLASNPQTLVLAFAAAESGTPTVGYSTTAAASTKQTNFVTELASLVESAGVTFVS